MSTEIAFSRSSLLVDSCLVLVRRKVGWLVSSEVATLLVGWQAGLLSSCTIDGFRIQKFDF